MKTKLTLFCLAILGIVTGCEDSSLQKSESVETYIELLKSNQYDSMNLPSLSSHDIPALLQYRNDKQIITNFPHNPISSFYNPQCTLGMYVLWTIESIRAVSVNSKSLILRFPSQNPILALRHSAELEMVFSPTAQDVAAQAYYDWWTTNEHQEFNAFKSIDPLQPTQYKWH